MKESGSAKSPRSREPFVIVRRRVRVDDPERCLLCVDDDATDSRRVAFDWNRLREDDIEAPRMIDDGGGSLGGGGGGSDTRYCRSADTAYECENVCVSVKCEC